LSPSSPFAAASAARGGEGELERGRESGGEMEGVGRDIILYEDEREIM
jgi:hypothetical protein